MRFMVSKALNIWKHCASIYKESELDEVRFIETEDGRYSGTSGYPRRYRCRKLGGANVYAALEPLRP